MKEVKIRGIVIAEASMGDKDKRLTLLTAEQGKLSVLAKGAKSASARSAACAQLFCYSEFVLNRGRTFYYIKEAEILDSFYELRTDMDAVAYASILVEMARVFSLDGENNSILMRLLIDGLSRLRKPDTSYRLISLIYMMRLATENGFLPELHHCIQCGKIYNAETHWTFSIERGGLICPTCNNQNKPPLRPGSISALQYITGAPLAKVYLFTVTKELEMELTPLIRQYVIRHTGMNLKSLDFVQSLENFM